MKRKIISGFLAIATVLSIFTFASLGVSATDNPSTLMNDAPVYKALGTAVTEIWSGSAAMETDDQTTVTFWLHVTDTNKPIYLIGTRFGFTTTDGTTFATHGTGSTNIQNNAFYIPENGDYLITATLGESYLAWNWKAENGYFASITSFGTAAIDAASFDADQSTVAAEASVALMGIIEGELATDRQVTYTAAGTTLGTSAGIYTAGTVKGISFNGNPNCYTDSTLDFYRVTAPYTAPQVPGKDFTGWADENGNRTLSLVTDNITATYEDKASSFVIGASQLIEGEGGEVTVKVADSTVGITSGTVTLQYDPNILSTESNTEKSGTVSFSFDNVEADGTVGKVSFAGLTEGSFSSEITINGTAKAGEGEVKISESKGTVRQIVLVNAGSQLIGKNDGTVSTEKQHLWAGSVPLNAADGITFVYKLDGVETDINTANFAIGYTGTKTNGTKQVKDCSASWDFWWQFSKLYEFSFTDDGYFYMYINIASNDMVHYDSVEYFSIYTYPDKLSFANRYNDNDNATFDMLAITAGNLQPTVTYHDDDGDVLATVTHKYTNINGAMDRTNPRISGSLLSPDELLLANGITVPHKDSGNPKVSYELEGWVDAEGKPVTAVYRDCHVYAKYKKTDTRSLYTVEFRDWNGTLLQSELIPEGETPEYKGQTPERETDDQYSYIFDGWDREIAQTPATDKTDGSVIAEPIVYTAKYKETVRYFTVIYMDENGETILVTETGIEEGTAAKEAPEVSKSPDEQYNYTFAGWADKAGNTVDLNSITSNMTLYPVFTSSLRTFTVKFLDHDGNTVKEETVTYGEAVTAPVITREEDKWYIYSFNGWYVNGEKADLEQITCDTEAVAVFDGSFKNPYTDLDLSQYYGDAVEYMLANGIMNGTGATTFTPNGTATRAMFVTVLYRMEDSPDVSDVTLPFSDVNSDEWYTDAIKWAYREKIVNGVSATAFVPDNNITREQFITILYRYAQYKEIDVTISTENTLVDFWDAHTVSSYSLDAVKWATAPENAFVGGMTEAGKTVIKPQATATRAQMATMLYRFLQKNS